MTPILAHRPRADRGFERMYRRHAGDVYRYALAVLHNSADAEDVTQTTFLNAYRAYERGERPRTPHHWLIAIAHNVCRQRFRQSMRRPNEVALEEEDVADTLVAEDDGPTSEDIRRALRHLAFNQRAALVMRELEGRSYAEIAEVLGLSIGAVETLIFRARRALREQLQGSLTCGGAELAISRQLDGRLDRAGKSALRAHLRECPECASFAKRQRAQRAALRSIGAVQLPSALASFFGGGASVGAGIAAKTAAMFAAAALAGTAGYEGTRHALDNHPRPGPHATTTHAKAPARAAPLAQVPLARFRSIAPVVSATAHSQHGAGEHGNSVPGGQAGEHHASGGGEHAFGQTGRQGQHGGPGESGDHHGSSPQGGGRSRPGGHRAGDDGNPGN